MSSLFKRLKTKQKSEKPAENKPVKNLNDSLAANLEMIKVRTGNSPDIIFRTFKIGASPTKNLAVVYVEGIVDSSTIDDFIIESIMRRHDQYKGSPQEMIQRLKEETISLGGIKTLEKWEDLFLSLMGGDTLVLVDGTSQAIAADTRGGEKRAVEQPESQVAVRGPRDGFTESIQTNMSLVRRRIKNPNLWTESMKIGTRTKTDVAIMYLHGVVNEGIVEEVRKRLSRINVDSVLESGYIEQLIEDETWPPLPTIYHTERPDSVAGNILEGRVAIFVDGSPFVLLAPAVFIQFFQSVEDYYSRFDIAMALRLLRLLIFFISLIAPSVYIAGTTFHQEMIPTQLVISIAAQRETVPFPAFVEAMMMEVTFEILREAGIRMPRAVGSAISIVGALVIGQAAVQAGIVSPAMVIVVSITAIANFATPSFAMAISTRLIRFPFMIAAAMFGMYGVILGLIILTVHLCSLRSFGVPYLTPFAPLTVGNTADTFIRLPLWLTRKRANLIMEGENIRGNHMPKPKPPIPRGMKRKKNTGGTNET
ncbi:spore germination protein GerUA [Bacillus freudenreichii]|nr:spore germination protein GerUA [Bacillus freudenreichii]